MVNTPCECSDVCVHQTVNAVSQSEPSNSLITHKCCAILKIAFQHNNQIAFVIFAIQHQSKE